MSHKIKPKDYLAPPGGPVDLQRWPTHDAGADLSDADIAALIASHARRMDQVQKRLYASDRYALLVVLQGMDAAGKDGVVRHVMSGINPQGCEVTSFKQPSTEELRHDFLWRASRALPARGMIGIFNRSYYEDVLIVRVHPELLAAEGVDPKKADSAFWRARYKSIRNFEAYLRRSRVRIVKIFLHISLEEQRRRFLSRIDDPDKNWKLSPADISERRHWDDYQRAYEAMIEATGAPHSPWYIVPADHKPSARLIVSTILLKALEGLKVDYPEATPEHRRGLIAVREQLAT